MNHQTKHLCHNDSFQELINHAVFTVLYVTAAIAILAAWSGYVYFGRFVAAGVRYQKFIHSSSIVDDSERKAS